jgi:DNA repair photolyase
MLFDQMAPPQSAPRLVGIAKLAREGETLADKAQVRYAELPTRRYITRCSSPRMPFSFTINPYRGCEFGCKYCYARYTHEFMELRQSEQFENEIFAKQWNAAAFRAELRRIPRDEHIAIGTATDPYQPAERRYGLTRRMLELFAAERGLRLSITTKSDLIARDTALLCEVAKRNVVYIHMTVTTLDARLARLLEPRAPRPDLRLAAVRTLADAGIQVGVFSSPILPGINDDAEALLALAMEAKRCGAIHFGGASLFLKPCAAKVFLPFVAKEFPELAAAYQRHFGQRAYPPESYKKRVSDRVCAAREAAGLSRRPIEYTPAEWDREEQLSLFAGEEPPPSFQPRVAGAIDLWEERADGRTIDAA